MYQVFCVCVCAFVLVLVQSVWFGSVFTLLHRCTLLSGNACGQIGCILIKSLAYYIILYGGSSIRWNSMASHKLTSVRACACVRAPPKESAEQPTQLYIDISTFLYLYTHEQANILMCAFVSICTFECVRWNVVKNSFHVQLSHASAIKAWMYICAYMFMYTGI